MKKKNGFVNCKRKKSGKNPKRGKNVKFLIFGNKMNKFYTCDINAEVQIKVDKCRKKTPIKLPLFSSTIEN